MHGWMFIEQSSGGVRVNRSIWCREPPQIVLLEALAKFLCPPPELVSEFGKCCICFEIFALMSAKGWGYDHEDS